MIGTEESLTDQNFRTLRCHKGKADKKQEREGTAKHREGREDGYISFVGISQPRE